MCAAHKLYATHACEAMSRGLRGRRHPDAVRSLHPTHAVTAIGPSASMLINDDLERGALGRGCALDK
eukprot:SAG31_NODE_28188_length_414_cov_0.901587_1_plen_66_part_01